MSQKLLDFKYVVFDFGGVLVDWSPQKISKMHTLDPNLQESVLNDILLHSDWLDLDAGLFTEPEMALRISARTNFSDSEVLDVFETVRRSFIPVDEVVVLLNTLVEKGVPCFGLSNMSKENYCYLKTTFPFFSKLKGSVISGHENVIKPNANIYKRLLEKFQLNASETLFIDDMLPNCHAAEALGFNTFQFERGSPRLANILLG
jgi:putative hydrolase of the HAD superfamily